MLSSNQLQGSKYGPISGSMKKIIEAVDIYFLMVRIPRKLSVKRRSFKEDKTYKGTVGKKLEKDSRNLGKT